MSDAIEIPRIRDRLDLPRWLVQKGLVAEGAEIGVLFGEFSAHLLKYWPGTLSLVDPWVQQPSEQWLDGCNAVRMDKAFQKTIDTVSPYADRAKIVRKFSLDAVNDFSDGSLSFAYLDGNHGHDNVAAELRAFWEKITHGGLLSGHDFYEQHTDWHDCGVETAVREFCAERGLKFYTTDCTSWWVEKT